MRTRLTGTMDGRGSGLSGGGWEIWACLESQLLVRGCGSERRGVTGVCVSGWGCGSGMEGVAVGWRVWQ